MAHIQFLTEALHNDLNPFTATDMNRTEAIKQQEWMVGLLNKFQLQTPYANNLCVDCRNPHSLPSFVVIVIVIVKS